MSSESPAHPEILLLAAGRGRWRVLRQVIADWDMLNAGVPSRVQLEQSIAILLGSKLIEAGDEGRFRVTRAGKRLLHDRQLRRLRPRARPSVLMGEFANHLQTPAPYVLDDDKYRAAVEAYVGR
ncbi:MULTISPECIES: hypothetical protein [unclassified Leifsonia]|uniref:hypothetical protein n=1 Tax=unclassified Leifsonia TaxID=2663824 RepID=UPI0012FD00C6|nr:MULTISPECIES: hypothetical protein [unclassified Leifsonia]